MSFPQTSSLDSVTVAIVEGHRKCIKKDRLKTSKSALQFQIYK
jgi:hypothetical protein